MAAPKPPRLTIPDALPPAPGLPSRARSNASIDAAPPMPHRHSTVAITSTGGWPPGQAIRSARLAARIRADAAGERAASLRALARERPEHRARETPKASTAAASSPAAVPRPRLWSSTRYGNAHSPVSVTNGAISAKCTHRPWRVAGARHAFRSVGSTAACTCSAARRRPVLEAVDGQDRQHRGQDPAGGEGRRPADVGQRRAQRRGAEQLPERPERRGQRGGEGVPAGR